MNILILTGKFGMGHFSAAKAIEEKILSEHPDFNVTVIDLLEYMFPRFGKMAYRMFNFLVNKCPLIYNVFGGLAARGNNAPFKKIIARKVNCLLKKHCTDVVISTLPLCSQYVATYKKIYHSNIILNTFITDVSIHDEWINKYTDLYFVPSGKTKDYLLSRKVDKDKIVVSGIPIKASFIAKSKYLKEKRVLIMGGGLGLIPSVDVFLDVLSHLKNVKVTLIVGKNEKMFHKYNHKYQNVLVIGFTNEVAKYMKDADLIITKAGGITLFEAIQSETPLLIITPFLNQEIGNAKYIQEKGIGKVIWHKSDDLFVDVIRFLKDETVLKEIRHNMRIIKAKMDKRSYLVNALGGF